MKDISDDVLSVLSGAEIEGSKLRLTGELDRKLYTSTDKVLKAAGGKWNRAAKAHVFEGPAADAIEPLLLTGRYANHKQDFGQFDTPHDLALEVVSMAEIRHGMSVLEPSAGLGNLARPASMVGGIVDCLEIDTGRILALIDGPFKSVECADFPQQPPTPTYHRVVMNPPFAKGADVQHVRHAFEFLMPGGRLVAIMSAAITFRQTKMFSEFRDWLEELDGTISPLPEESFKESGTGVSAVIVIIDKPQA